MGDSGLDLTHTSWRDDLWLQAYGISPLNILDYFSLSPFYDKNCSNEGAKQQGLELTQLAILAPGIEYVLRDAQPPHLFVICRQHRAAPSAPAAPQAVYYVLDGTVYQAPALHAALTNRMARCRFSMQAAFTAMQEDLHPCIAALELSRAGAFDPVEPRHDATSPTDLAQATPGPRAIDPERASKLEASLRTVLARYPLPVLAAPAPEQANPPAEPAAEAPVADLARGAPAATAPASSHAASHQPPVG
ncbi:hypothetical protein ACKKBG_A05035 [Auxenochlorella protothecoides x Auxenochlorella symbiontica]